MIAVAITSKLSHYWYIVLLLTLNSSLAITLSAGIIPLPPWQPRIAACVSGGRLGEGLRRPGKGDVRAPSASSDVYRFSGVV